MDAALREEVSGLVGCRDEVRVGKAERLDGVVEAIVGLTRDGMWGEEASSKRLIPMVFCRRLNRHARANCQTQ